MRFENQGEPQTLQIKVEDKPPCCPVGNVDLEWGKFANDIEFASSEIRFTSVSRPGPLLVRYWKIP